MRALVAALLLAAPAAAQPLEVQVTGAGEGGRIVVGLFAVSDGFARLDMARAAQRATAVPVGGEARVRFDQLAPGRYAIAAFHDADGDGRLRTNVIGIPREAVGVSNNPGGMPRFARSAIVVPADRPVVIRLVRIGS